MLCEDGGYTAIANEDECLHAAMYIMDIDDLDDFNDYNYHGYKLEFYTETDSGYPSGCYIYDDDDVNYMNIYFNYHSKGPRNPKVEAICFC